MSSMSFWSEIERLLPLVEKPGRYIGGELGSIVKDHEGKLRFALVFPEVYELGASHFGGLVIYNIVNKDPELVCERIYMPWHDMRNLMRQRRIPPLSLETKTPISQFDVVGFTLENELSYTNVLEMLDMGGIPLRSSARGEGDPIVIAGGSCAFHPEPVAEFFDAIYVGDAEVALVDLLHYVKRNKGALPRRKLLEGLCEFPGVYVPSLYGVRYDGGRFAGFSAEGGAPLPVKAATVPRLEDGFYPTPPIVPWVEVVHNRLRAELARGCGRGCRFCESGFTYRPLRERPAEAVVAELMRNFAATGWDEIGLLALSTTDYSDLDGLVRRLGGWVKDNKLKFALPSVRVEHVSDELLELVGYGRKSGLTFAPEAGTQRLRAVLNKPLDEDKFFETLELAFRKKWRSVKLYFMFGLPTETEDDLDGLVDLVRRADALAKRYKAKLKVALSPFVPRPHTPFQWERQLGAEELRRREEYVLSRLPRRVEVLRRNPYVSILEGVLARGDRRFCDIIELAWRKGGIYAAWSEFFEPRIFLEALEEVGFSLEGCLAERAEDEPLPWDVIDKGLRRDFLRAERARAMQGKLTLPCWTRDCARCRFCDVPQQVLARTSAASAATSFGRRPRREHKTPLVFAPVVRVRYARRGLMRFLGHLDVLRLWERTLRRARFPVAFTEGYHVHPKLSFSPPLPLGAESEAEYVDVFLSGAVSEANIHALARALPEGMELRGYQPFHRKPKPLQASVEAALWECEVAASRSLVEDALNWVTQQGSISFRRHERTVDIRPLILAWRIDGGNKARCSFSLVLRAGDKGSGRPQEFLIAAGMSEETALCGRFVRKELLIPAAEGWKTPFGEPFEIDRSFRLTAKS